MNVKAMQRNEMGSRRHYVYSYLYQNILSLNLQPGCALSENEIAKQLNVSRTPVREAMIQLAKQDLVEIVPQIGTFVSLINPELVEESRSMRETLEIAAIKEAAEKITESTLLELEISINKQKLIIKEGNFREFFTLDDAFHEIIFKSLGKERTWQAIEQINSQFKRVRILWLSLTTTTDWEEVLREHEGLYTALKNRDACLAEKLVKEHLTKAVIHMGVIKAKHPDYFKS
ncbi:DNA-binding GntR family transcriptional regulator [Neobacillus niacini]|uniref:GntR family transcriptional regulator n=1 Tax=Neobacillus niacini TaxID=86668 RepID=UPI00277EEF95|nr:GntR family transcriptional regulator [Neobacillus niacini]MDQ1004540.1 DNA-binding GntR family transcriptional regulator [Neobacillus niacini]